MSDTLGYDEDKAVEFIRSTLSPEVNGMYSDDDILYVIDIIWEWYDKNGFLSLDSDVTEEEEHDISRLTRYVESQLGKDKEFVVDTTDIESIVRGEIQYEESIEDAF